MAVALFANLFVPSTAFAAQNARAELAPGVVLLSLSGRVGTKIEGGILATPENISPPNGHFDGKEEPITVDHAFRRSARYFWYWWVRLKYTGYPNGGIAIDVAEPYSVLSALRSDCIGDSGPKFNPLVRSVCLPAEVDDAPGLDADSGRLSHIFYRNRAPHSLSVDLESSFGARNVGTSLRLANISSVVRHPLRFANRKPDQSNRHPADDQPEESRKAHHLREERHGLLGAKILLGAVGLCGSLYLMLYTLPQGYRFSGATFLRNSIAGLLGLSLSTLFIVYALLG